MAGTTKLGALATKRWLIPEERDPFPLWADVPDWVPRCGHTSATPALLRVVLARLRDRL
ncbi:hypothetical protein [Streptomyces sp. NPDC048340]|uniref:hypothetical protein n=1 Tax=Streptomyces sp. NPDC048340 TaxID=3365537 RepID=UPI003718137E